MRAPLAPHALARVALAFGALWLAAIAPLAARAQAQATAPALTPDDRAAIVDSLAAMLGAMYVSPDTGRLIAEHLRARLRGKAYDAATTRGDFAVLLTRDLRAINADGHLAVDREGTFAGPRTPPAVAARRANYNIDRVERLDGNVGYLRLSAFSPSPEAFDALVGALRTVAATDAMIIDLRNSRGGSGDLANFLISHFTGPDSTRSLGIYQRSENDTVYRWTLATVPGPRRPDVPLYVLVDGVTRSAAEDVTFVLHGLGRARVVGEHTAGAGHPVAVVSLGAGLVATMSIARVFDARTGAEWERVGVPIDLRVPAATALTVAHAEALERLAARETDAARRGELTLWRETVLARARPIATVATSLVRLVGDYGGGGLVTLADGQLSQQTRRDQPRTPLVPLSATRFAAGATRLEFIGDGAARRLRVTPPGEAAVTYARIGAVRGGA